MSSSPRLPLGVLIPTLNARKEVESFLPQLQPVLDLAEQVVVVDSYSDDGTLAWLQSNLHHPNAAFLSHPRGLYQSWNFGLQQLKTEFAYIATIGDLAAPDGLQHLVSVARQFDSDAVLSPPEFYDVQGTRLDTGSNWPIHRLLGRCHFPGPVRLEPWEVFLLATVDVPRGILGSSASNLYRTRFLQENPFPVTFGHAGDSAWAIRNAFRASLAITPKVFSRFVIHPNETAGMSKEKYRNLVNSMFGLALETAAEARRQSNHQGEWLGLICSAPDQLRLLYECQDRYDSARRAVRPWPWIFSRNAWATRAQRNAQRDSVLQLAAQIRTAPFRPKTTAPWEDSLLEFVADCVKKVC